MENVPEGFNLYASYVAVEEAKAICIWKAPSTEALNRFFEEKTPGMKQKVYKIMQFYPPSIDLYSMIYSILSQS